MNWEPGQTHIKYIKIANRGNLSFKYSLNVISNGTDEDLGKVIDVYFDSAPSSPLVNFAELKAQIQKIGTLSDTYNSSIKNSVLLPNGSESDEYSVGSEIFTLALHMQEEAGNEYQDKILGSFDLILTATQFTAEHDSFGNDYDSNSDVTQTPVVTRELPLVKGAVESLPAEAISASTGVTFANAPYA